MTKQLASVLIACAFVLGMGVGYMITPWYVMPGIDDMAGGLGRADASFDWRYVNLMGAHHRGAIALAEQAKNASNRPEIRALADEIMTGEPKLIEELAGWKRSWYGDLAPIPAPRDVVRLGEAGENFDLRFLNALIAHHEAGVAMAREAMTRSSRGEVLDNAQAVADFLTGGIVMLKEWRNSWYGL